MRKHGALFFFLLLRFVPGAAPPAVLAQSRPFAAEDIVAFKSVVDMAASPDTKMVVVSLRSANADGARFETDLWLVPLDGRPSRQLTFAPGSESTAAWSPDGSRVAYLARHDEVAELRVLPLAGGEGSAYAAARGPVASFAWSPDGRRIALIGPLDDPEQDARRRRERDDAYRIGAEWRNHRVWLATEGGQVRAMTDGRRHVRLARWSPDGTQMALITTPSPEADSTEDARVELLDLDSGRLREVPESLRASNVKWSPDGLLLLIVRPYDGQGISREDAFVWPIGGARALNLTRGIDRDIEQVFWRDPKRVEVLYAAGTASAVSTIDLESSSVIETWAPGVPLSELEPAGNAWVFVGGDQPHELQIKEGEKTRRLTSWNAERAAAVMLPVVETIKWRSAVGPLEGVLVRPAELVAGRRYPLLVVPHGGPRARSVADFDAHAAFFVAKGYLVFKPNFRGSTGYGDLFSRANVANWGEGPLRDVIAGIEALVLKGIVDPARLFIYGWSYGGYLTNWAVTHGGQFRAAASGAGVADLRMQYALSDARRWRFDYFSGTPFDSANLPMYERDSPVNYTRQARTPTLFVHGEEDRRCPLAQGLLMHRALKDSGVETEMVVYPREGHGFVEPRHIIDRARRIADWFAAHDGPLPPARRTTAS